MSQMSSVVQKAMANLPSSKRGLSVFNQTHTKLTNMEPDYLVPIGCFFVYPNDILDIDLTGIMRILNLKVPPMAGLTTRFYAFYDRCRNLWDGWDIFTGAYDQQDVDDGLIDPDKVLPHVSVKPALGSIFDYFDAPIRTEDGGKVANNIRLNALKYRLYNKVWNEWFKKDNIQRKVKVNKGDDGTDLPNDFTLLKTNKHLDLFTSCLPWAQKGEAITIGLGSQAPVRVIENQENTTRTIYGAGDDIVKQVSTGSYVINNGKATDQRVDKVKEIAMWVAEPTTPMKGTSDNINGLTNSLNGVNGQEFYTYSNTNNNYATKFDGQQENGIDEGILMTLQTRYFEKKDTTQERQDVLKYNRILAKDATAIKENEFAYYTTAYDPNATKNYGNAGTPNTIINATNPFSDAGLKSFPTALAEAGVNKQTASKHNWIVYSPIGRTWETQIGYTNDQNLNVRKAVTSSQITTARQTANGKDVKFSNFKLDNPALAWEGATKYAEDEPMGRLRMRDLNNTFTADLSTATAQTVNDIRYAVMRQQFAETMARAGSGRYNEVIMALWGIDTGGVEIQRSEYLGSFKIDWNWQEIAQTSESTQESPQGNLTAQGTSIFKRKKIVRKAFSDYGYVLILASTAADISYSQGLSKDDIREDFLDFTNNIFMHSGEQPIFTKELFATGDLEEDNKIFGYNEYAARDRYEPSKINGDFRPLKLNNNFVQNLYGWSLTQYFENKPTLSPQFIENNTPLERIVAQTENPRAIMMDLCFSIKRMTQIAVYSTPGLTKL